MSQCSLEAVGLTMSASLKAMPQDIILNVVPHSESGHKYATSLIGLPTCVGLKKCFVRRVLQKMGEILYLRDVLNLRGCLETPKAYWNKPGTLHEVESAGFITKGAELEEMYNRIWVEFELGHRMFLLNQKVRVRWKVVN